MFGRTAKNHGTPMPRQERVYADTCLGVVKTDISICRRLHLQLEASLDDRFHEVINAIALCQVNVFEFDGSPEDGSNFSHWSEILHAGISDFGA